MNVWRATDIDEEPVATLTDWGIFELPNGDRHFAGYAVEASEGRTSSAVEEFDVRALRGRTRSGRTYQLKGAPGLSLDARYVWNTWRCINDVGECRDVSREVWAAHRLSRIPR